MVDELVHQLKASKAKIIITVPASLNIALAAAKEVGIPPTGILLFSSNDATSRGHTTIDESVVKGLQHETAFVEPRLGSEEGKKKVRTSQPSTMVLLIPRRSPS
jgi:4-coumarate--CoA ligase